MKNREITEKEKEALNLSADLWNKFKEIDWQNPHDVDELRLHIHAIQNTLYTNLYLRGKQKGDK